MIRSRHFSGDVSSLKSKGPKEHYLRVRLKFQCSSALLIVSQRDSSTAVGSYRTVRYRYSYAYHIIPKIFRSKFALRNIELYLSRFMISNVFCPPCLGIPVFLMQRMNESSASMYDDDTINIKYRNRIPYS